MKLEPIESLRAEQGPAVSSDDYGLDLAKTSDCEGQFFFKSRSDHGDFLVAPAAGAKAGARLAPPAMLATYSAPSANSSRRMTLADGARRTLEVIATLGMLVFFLPILLLVTLAIFLFDPGPVIFRQTRIGRDGRTFECLKFRSMYVGAEDRLSDFLGKHPEMRRQWLEVRKLDPDPRITSIGRFLRRSSIDELPQLVNVLRGEMSLVGPRPIVEAEMSRYGRYIAEYQSTRPGLTGLWQISGRNDVSYRRRVALDVVYSRKRSLKLDGAILLATIPAALFGRGAS